MHHLTMRLAALLMTLGLLATACGGDGTDTAADTAPEDDAAATTAPADDTAAAEDPADDAAATEEPPDDVAATDTADAGGGGGTIGFSVYDMQFEFFQSMEEGTREAVEELGYDYQLHDERSDENEMVTGAQSLLDQGVAALIISPFKPDALGPIVQAAHAQDIPVVINDIGGGGTDYDAIVISDNEGGGVLAADHMDELLSARDAGTQVASITCQPDAVYASRRNAGFTARMEELGYEVVAELNANSNADEAYTVMQDILSAHPDVAGVFSCNDPMAVAAANAITDAGRDPVDDVTVIGFNADPEAIEAISAGNLAATVAQFPAEMGRLSVELADQLIRGEELEFDNPDEREVYAEVELVTPENVEDFGQ